MQVTPIDYGRHGEIAGFISSRLMAAYTFPEDHTLHVSFAERDFEGRLRISYVLEHDSTVIFEGDDIRSGCRQELSYAEAARSVLGWLTLRPGDTDDEFFDSYTPEQEAWRDMYAEDLSIYAMHPNDLS